MSISVKSTAWPYLVKQPIDSGAVLNYGIDWSDWIPDGAAIASAIWTITGGAEEHSAIVGAVTYVWLSVATAATEVKATVHIALDTTPIALEDERTLILTVADR